MDTPAAFPRSAAYHPDWLRAGVSGGANPLLLAEWLCQALDLRPGMRVLDLGCGRGLSSVFLRREFGVAVWAADLWFDPTDCQRRAADAGVADGVFPLRADARALPFAEEFFDAIVSIDSFMYYGTDDQFLGNLARFVKPGGPIAVALAGLTRELDAGPPEALKSWWQPDMACLHSAAWWRRHWERSGVVDVELADDMPDGWRRWLDWHRLVCPDNAIEIAAVEADAGATLAYVRAVARRRAGVALSGPIERLPAEYVAAPLLREAVTS